MDKVICSSPEYCEYRALKSSKCNYSFYCDFQRPRDSRTLNWNKEASDG